MTERQAAEARADKWFSLYIRRRDHHCVTCGSFYELTCGHYVTRQRRPTRWREDNAGCQCSVCNNIHEENPEPLGEWINEIFGQGTTTNLEQISVRPFRLSTAEIGDIADYWRQMAMAIEGGQ